MKERSGESGLEPGGGSRLLVRDPRSQTKSVAASHACTAAMAELGQEPGAVRGKQEDVLCYSPVLLLI